MKKFSSFKGFTLIELLIVITIISTLAVTVFVALNPAQRLKDSKDARRTSDVDTILTAIHAAIVDNGGNYPTNMPAVGTEAMLIQGASGTCNISNTNCTIAAATCADLMAGPISLTKYLKSLPIDPSGTGATTPFSATRTGYSVQRDANGIVTVKACGTEGTTLIQSSR